MLESTQKMWEGLSNGGVMYKHTMTVVWFFSRTTQK